MLRSIFVAVMLLFSTVVNALAEGRVALVVGVSNYEHAARLANTRNDANDVAAALKRLGFDVEILQDPNRLALEGAVRRYGDRSVNADVSLFYFSGHALESVGRNWLLPASANLATERDLRFEAIDLNAVQEQADGAAKISLIFLDACRDNPFSRRLAATRRGGSPGGLARVDMTLGGVLVAFSTGPGQVAIDGIGAKRNSPFTAALLKHIESPGLEIKSLLAHVTKDVVEETNGMQRPWQNSSLEGDFYFLPPPVVAAASSAQSLVTLDSMFWDSVKVSRNPADFKAYLARFPQGVFAELAQNRLSALQQDAVPGSKGVDAPKIAQLQAPRSTRPAVLSPDRDETTSMLERARALVSTGDISAARIVLRRAYERGDERAALELGGTYDPRILKRLNLTINNSLADVAQARDWYIKAAELGSIDAIYRINELDSRNR
jgi:hypothetical protein